MLEAAGFSFTDKQFKEVMEAVTDDIKFNRIGFKKKTSINGMLMIAEIFSGVSGRAEEENGDGCRA